jgi:hypothetical protein
MTTPPDGTPAPRLWCCRCARWLFPEALHRQAGVAWPLHNGCGGRVLDPATDDARLMPAVLHLHELERALTEARYHAEQLGERDLNALALRLIDGLRAVHRWRARHGMTPAR